MRRQLLVVLAAVLLCATVFEGSFANLPAGPDESETGLLAELAAAKEMGDMSAAREIERELAAIEGRSLESASVVPAGLGLRVESADPGASLSKGRWADDDILVAGLAANEVRPSMASDREGNLYVAVEHEGSSDTAIRIYKSEDGGLSWSFFRMVSALSDLSQPSIAVAEGTESWLFLAFQLGEDLILSFRVNLDSTAESDIRTIENNAVGVANPRIATDGAEFAGWYPYVVWNSRGVDNWVLRFTRSLDYGDSWQTPATLAGYCGYPDEFYDGNEAYPDIDYGSGYLYVAFDNYTSNCTSTDRDVFAMRSANYGATWASAIRLSPEADDERGPRVAAVKNYAAQRTAVVVYTRFWGGLDDDIMYHGTQDGGTTWSNHRCMSCTPIAEERSPDIETSFDRGRIHAAWWRDHNIEYRSALYSSPLAWGDTVKVCESDAASFEFPRPTVGVNPTAPVDEEAGIAWTDFRNAPTANDIYYDGPGAISTGLDEAASVPPVTRLDPVRPNPFNPAAHLRYALSAPGTVHLTVYDAAGRRVAVLAEGPHEAGIFETIWRGVDDTGCDVSSGVYFARLKTEEGARTRKITLIR
jgi:hypothetical protein